MSNTVQHRLLALFRRLEMGLVLALAPSVLVACSQLDECETDSDCPAKHHCVKNRVALNESSYCAYDESADEDTTSRSDTAPRDTNIPPMCDTSCGGELASVPGGICDDDGELCALDCTAVEGRSDCDGELENGCEIDTTTADDHCGVCGNDCATVLAETGQTGVCQDGQCVPTGCLESEGRFDLDGDPSNGCEVAAGLTDPTGVDLGATVETFGVVRPSAGLSLVLSHIVTETMTRVHILTDDGDLGSTTIPPGDTEPITQFRGMTTSGGDGWAVNVGFQDAASTAVFDGAERRIHSVHPFMLTGTDLTRLVGVPASLADFVWLEGATLSWEEIVPSSTPSAELAGSPSTDACDFFNMPQKRCPIDEVALDDTKTWTAVRVLPLLDLEMVMVLAADGTVAYVALDALTGELQPWTLESTAVTLPSVVDIEPWVAAGGGSGFALLTETGAVRFYSVRATDAMRLLHEAQTVGPPELLPPPASTPRDLVPLGGQRYAVISDDGVHIVSTRDGETETPHLQPAGHDSGWRHGARAGVGDDVLALTRETEIFLVPLSFPKD